MMILMMMVAMISVLLPTALFTTHTLSIYIYRMVGIPHDIRTMHELWGVNTYRKRNLYFSSACIMDLVSELPDNGDKIALQTTINVLLKKYNDMADKYHSEKANNADNSLVLG
jgi:hypothetical protein